MLSDKLKTRKSPKKTPLGDRNRRWYTDSEKLEAVKLWLVTGNLQATAASLGIAHPTMQQWRYSKWWDELASEIRSESTLQLSNKLKRIAEKALDITFDRLEHGDWFYDQKTGEVRRKPVVLRDAAQVANGFLDRHMTLDQKPVEEKAQQQVQDRLNALAEAFAKMANKTKKVEVIDAIYEERQERLPGGEGVGAQEETLSLEGSCEEGSGPESDGEGEWEPASFSACGSQEASEGWGLERQEQSEVDVRQVESL